ncbi:MAG TPA: hypothetical protein VEL76_32575 [Gemmataceae bacterium]|nr:hypothetical protein [Gemmataceae bacterium]
MKVRKEDGSCPSCGGELEIIDVDDEMMTVECTVCQEQDVVETDAFHDGCTLYWPAMMARKLEEREA